MPFNSLFLNPDNFSVKNLQLIPVIKILFWKDELIHYSAGLNNFSV